MSKTDQKSIPAVSLKSLGDTAPEFAMPVEIKRRDGALVAIAFTVKGLRKSEWAAHRDAYLKSIRVEAKPEDSEFSFAGLVSNGVNEAADLILKAATGWDLEDAMDVKNIVELEDILPSTISATLNKIDGALFQGRLGN